MGFGSLSSMLRGYCMCLIMWIQSRFCDLLLVAYHDWSKLIASVGLILVPIYHSAIYSIGLFYLGLAIAVRPMYHYFSYCLWLVSRRIATMHLCWQYCTKLYIFKHFSLSFCQFTMLRAGWTNVYSLFWTKTSKAPLNSQFLMTLVQYVYIFTFESSNIFECLFHECIANLFINSSVPCLFTRTVL